MLTPSATDIDVARFGRYTDNSQNVAVIVHTDEHFCRGDEGQLVGPQAMRKRVLKRMGFRLMEVESSAIARLRVRSCLTHCLDDSDDV